MDERIKRSRAQESAVAKKFGGSTNVMSGAGWKRKSDVRSQVAGHDVLWEMKRTDKKSISLKLDDLEKHRKFAWEEDRVPLFHLEIGDRRYIIMEESDSELFFA